MKKTLNGINPITAILLTVLAAVLTVVFFTGWHIFWGIVFAFIAVDFFADVILCVKRA